MSLRLPTTTAVGAALLASLATGGVAQAKPAKAAASQLKGTVVHRIVHAHAFVIADAHGKMTAIHATRSPAVGRRVTVGVRLLRNGRFAAKRIVVGAHVRKTRIRGTVTFANRRGGTFVVSARGVSLLVRRGARGRVRAASAPGIPGVGTIVTVDANLDQNGEIQAESIDEQGVDSGVIDLEGVITAVDPAKRTLTITADDDEQSGASLTVHLPDTFDLTAFTVGDAVELEATLDADGSYTAVQSSKDNNADNADDTSDDQGDGNNDQSGDGGGKADQSGGGDQQD
jgi:hypothetical protein